MEGKESFCIAATVIDCDKVTLPRTSTPITVSDVPPQQSTSSSRHVQQVVAVSLPCLRRRRLRARVLLFFVLFFARL